MNNPFNSHFESFEGPLSPVVETLHQTEFLRLKELATGDDGVLVSLRAPRAGFGKTMLLSRLREAIREESVIVPVELSSEFLIDEEGILTRILDQLLNRLSGRGGVTRLDLWVRRLLASGLIPMVESGEVPSPNRNESLRSLNEQPEEVFDFHKDTAVVAQWVKAQFTMLSPRLLAVIGKSCGVTTGDLAFWFNVLCRFAMSPKEDVRNTELTRQMFGEKSRFRAGSGYHGGLVALLRLLTLTENVVLVVDEVDGLYGNSEAGLRVASALIAIRQAAPRMKLIFSVNDDVWETTFARRLPLGMQDRFEDCVLRLAPLDDQVVSELVKSRQTAGSDDVVKQLQLEHDQLYPRAVLRAAREAWGRLSEKKEELPSSPAIDDEPLAKPKDIGFAEVPVESSSGTAKVQPSASASPSTQVPRHFIYPPGPVRRIGIPRKYFVQRIRKETDSVRIPPAPPLGPKYDSPFQIAGQDQSAVGPKNEADSIEDLLRKFQERQDS